MSIGDSVLLISFTLVWKQNLAFRVTPYIMRYNHPKTILSISYRFQTRHLSGPDAGASSKNAGPIEAPELPETSQQHLG